MKQTGNNFPITVLYKNLGRLDQAASALSWLRGPEYNIQPELNQISDRVQLDSNRAFSLTDFSSPGVYKPVLMGMSLMIFQQFSGLNAALFFSGNHFNISIQLEIVFLILYFLQWRFSGLLAQVWILL